MKLKFFPFARLMFEMEMTPCEAERTLMDLVQESNNLNGIPNGKLFSGRVNHSMFTVIPIQPKALKYGWLRIFRPVLIGEICPFLTGSQIRITTKLRPITYIVSFGLFVFMASTQSPLNPSSLFLPVSNSCIAPCLMFFFLSISFVSELISPSISDKVVAIVCCSYPAFGNGT